MSFPVYVSLFTVSIPLHSVMETLGMFLGFRYFLYLRKQQGDSLQDNNRVWVIIGAIFGA